MSRTLIYAGIVVPSTVEQQIEDAIYQQYPHSPALRAAMEIGCIAGWLGKSNTLSAAMSPSVDAFRLGHVVGHQIRTGGDVLEEIKARMAVKSAEIRRDLNKRFDAAEREWSLRVRA